MSENNDSAISSIPVNDQFINPWKYSFFFHGGRMYDKEVPKCQLKPLPPSSVCTLCADGGWYRNGPWWLFGCTVHTFFTAAVWDPDMELTEETVKQAKSEPLKSAPFWRPVRCHHCGNKCIKVQDAWVCGFCTNAGMSQTSTSKTETALVEAEDDGYDTAIDYDAFPFID